MEICNDKILEMLVHEESKKSFKVIPKPRQILSMVSTLS